MDKCNDSVYPFVGRFILVVNLIKLNNMKNFDLAAAKAGAPVCTRSGRNARIICDDRRGEPHSRIIALLDAGEYEHVELYSLEGILIPDTTTLNDLMMRDDDYAEKLARGEYGPTVKEKLTVDNPTCKESLPVDREYWRRVYAGYVLAGSCARVSRLSAEGVKFAIALADALLEELEKTEKKL